MYDLPSKAFVMPAVMTALMSYHTEEFVPFPV